MEETVEKIKTLRFKNRNVDRRFFVPEVALFGLMTQSTVKACLKGLQIPSHELDNLTDEVMHGARKCFAILLLIGKGGAIKDFITRDDLQHNSPDDRLPFNSEALKDYLKVPEAESLVPTFMETQWCFTTPTLAHSLLSRELNDDAILPYLYEEQAGNSSMGRVLKVKIHKDCHRLRIEDNKVIRKEISSTGDDSQLAFRHELKNLALLECIRHPNIIELYCSYFYRKNFNLVFPVADGGTLEMVLERPRDSVWPLTDSQIFIALTGLASAIDTLHNFESKSLDLNLTGCHHDLAPRNILVQKDTILLADFGLSTLKCPQESSLTNYKSVRGSYVAPEGQPIRDGRLQNGLISRPGDIWSFGCILLEVFTYMLHDNLGLKDFREARRTEINSELVWSRFYDGRDVPSSQVVANIEKLLQHDKPTFSHALGLVRRMLNENPGVRPRSAEVLLTLRGIAILSLAETIKPLLDDACASSPSLDYSLENFRFFSWMSAFENLFDDITSRDYRGKELDTDATIQSLNGFQKVLQAGHDKDPHFNHQRISALGWHSDKMFEALPKSYQSLAKTSLVKHVLNCDHVERLSQLRQETDMEDDDDLGTLVAVKHLTQLSVEGRLILRQDLQLDDISFDTKCEVGPHIFALTNGDRPEKVIIEWLKYREHWADKNIGPELRKRLVSIATLLNSDYTSRLPGTLRCKGIQHNSAKRAIGFVYELPPSTDRPMTLHQLLVESRYRPLLEDRFRLARDICHSLYKFHQLGWLHRNIHSENIIFLLSEGAVDNKAATEPHFLGFSGSRETRLDAFTRGAGDAGNLRNYQHPMYLQPDGRGERYREEFDYYSIGMILLEIGMWTPLSRWEKDFRGHSDEEYRQGIIKRKVSKLGLTMGSRYMQAVLVCLRGDFDRSSQAGFAEAFKRQVIDGIHSLE